MMIPVIGVPIFNVVPVIFLCGVWVVVIIPLVFICCFELIGEAAIGTARGLCIVPNNCILPVAAT